MTPLLYTALSIVALFAAVAWMSVERHKRHDRVLSPFYKIRRNLMDVTLADRGVFSRREDASARFLLAMTNGIIRHYHSHRTVLFDIRKVRRIIEKDLRRYRKTQEMVRAQIEDMPDNRKIRDAYADFVRATTDAFVANTPFVREEIILRLIWRDLAKQIASARHESDRVLHKVGREFA